MNRQKRHLVVLVVAVVTATIASFGVYRAVDRMPVREVPWPTSSWWLPLAPLPLGTQLTERDVKVVAWPAASPLAGAFAKVSDVVNRPLRHVRARERAARARQAGAARRRRAACPPPFRAACARSR